MLQPCVEWGGGPLSAFILGQCRIALALLITAISFFCTACWQKGPYDPKTICGSGPASKSCGVGNPYFANLLKRGEPVRVDVEKGYPSEYLGVQFEGGKVHSSSEACPASIRFPRSWGVLIVAEQNPAVNWLDTAEPPSAVASLCRLWFIHA